MINAAETSSTRPYLIRAIYEWCADNGLTPYVAVAVDGSVQVPYEFVKNNEIVLNVSLDATSALKLGNEFIEFKARFGGIPREIMVPIERVMAIFAKENGQGMSFPLATAKAERAGGINPGQPLLADDSPPVKTTESKSVLLASVKKPARPRATSDTPPEPQTPKSTPTLKRVK